ncbi:MAG: hypothetical protein IKP73_15690 [Bacteroidales bacterium]|nr:hypothetical protein [Bacteroidales bacterium]
MSDLKKKIDEILSERKSRIGMISLRNDLIDSLYPNLQKIQKTISELGVEGVDEKVETISKFLSNLDQAREKLRLIQKRYAKDTINIGVSGFTHAGKSTLLQAISGLTDNEIPKADEDAEDSLHATTAICSQIFNSAEKYAEIFYKTDHEFVEFVNAHLKIAGLSQISDKGEFTKIQIPENNDTEEEKNTIKDRLRLLQESFPFYKDKIGNGYEKISGNNLTRLDSYVSYSKSDKMTRFFPAVKEVKIYSPFPALGNPDVKLCLVDLPGFGEFNEVDKIQISNLKEIVDHIIFIYKTDDSLGIDKKHFRESYFEIKGIHPAQSNNKDFLLNFLSFLINEKRVGNWQNLVRQTVNTIQSTYGNYKYYSFPALLDNQPNKQDAEKNLNDILSRLSQTLPQMDECLLKSLNQSLDISELMFLLKDLAKFVNQYSYANEDTSNFHKKGVRFREDFNKDLEKLLAKYQKESEEIDNGFCNKVSAIATQTDSDIADNLLYKPSTERPTWDIYIDYAAKGDNASTFASELRRVWVETLGRYINLDEDFSQHIDKLKKEVLDLFDSRSHIVPKDENGEYNLLALLEKLQCLGNDNELTLAFTSLQTLTQNFRQNLYPYIFRDQLEKGMLTTANGGTRQLDTSQDLRFIENYKRQLVPMCQNNNYEISKNIQQNFVLSYFLIGALHTFMESITYAKTDYDADFVKFCSIFRKNIYPEEYGSEADSAKVEELRVMLEQTKELINTIQ